MSQISEWKGFTELFEINQEGLIDFLCKQQQLLSVFEKSRKNMGSSYEKSLIINAKNDLKETLVKVRGENSDLLSETECEKVMIKIYQLLKNLYEFVELEFLN